MISARLLKLALDIIAGPLVNILSKCILQETFPILMKVAVFPRYIKEDKKNDLFNKENSRPVNVLTALSKISEKAIKYKLSPFLNCNFSNFLCAYRKHFSSQYALIEEWKTHLESKKTTTVVLMDIIQGL